jgi:hypothetical protein
VSELDQDDFGNFSRCLTSMGWRYSSCMPRSSLTRRFVRRLRWWKLMSWSTRLLLHALSHSKKERHFRLIWVEVKLCNATSIRYFLFSNSPNSWPSERLFSISNATYNANQKKSHTDYIKLYIQVLVGLTIASRLGEHTRYITLLLSSIFQGKTLIAVHNRLFITWSRLLQSIIDYS